MKYEKVVAGRFLARPNRFIAQVDMDGRTETVHVKNTGRCRELLVPGARVYLAEGSNPARKTRYDLVAVRKGDRLINMDSQAPNAAALEWLRAGNVFPAGREIKPEYTYGDSRFDIAAFVETRSTGLSPAQAPEFECSAVSPLPTRFASLDSRGDPNSSELALLEVKGVTLERDGVVLFPDAPTVRGTKHLRELTRFAAEGGGAYVLFVVQMEDVAYFAPNEATDPAFAAALRQARDAGVRILAYDCRVTPDSMTVNRPVEIRL